MTGFLVLAFFALEKVGGELGAPRIVGRGRRGAGEGEELGGYVVEEETGERKLDGLKRREKAEQWKRRVC